MSHRLIHWGSLPVPRDEGGVAPPRHAISIDTASADYEAPFFSRDHLPYPPLPLRVALAAAQQIRYIHQLDPGVERASQYFSLFVAEAIHFDHDFFRSICAVYADKYLDGNMALLREYFDIGSQLKLQDTRGLTELQIYDY